MTASIGTATTVTAINEAVGDVLTALRDAGDALYSLAPSVARRVTANLADVHAVNETDAEGAGRAYAQAVNRAAEAARDAEAAFSFLRGTGEVALTDFKAKDIGIR